MKSMGESRRLKTVAALIALIASASPPSAFTAGDRAIGAQRKLAVVGRVAPVKFGARMPGVNEKIDIIADAERIVVGERLIIAQIEADEAFVEIDSARERYVGQVEIISVGAKGIVGRIVDLRREIPARSALLSPSRARRRPAALKVLMETIFNEIARRDRSGRAPLRALILGALDSTDRSSEATRRIDARIRQLICSESSIDCVSERDLNEILWRFQTDGAPIVDEDDFMRALRESGADALIETRVGPIDPGSERIDLLLTLRYRAGTSSSDVDRRRVWFWFSLARSEVGVERGMFELASLRSEPARKERLTIRLIDPASATGIDETMVETRDLGDQLKRERAEDINSITISRPRASIDGQERFIDPRGFFYDQPIRHGERRIEFGFQIRIDRVDGSFKTIDRPIKKSVTVSVGPDGPALVEFGARVSVAERTVAILTKVAPAQARLDEPR